MNTIQTSLEVLKEASALIEKIPYISPVAGLLLQALKMRDVSIRVSRLSDVLSYRHAHRR
jgi:hypothetical protein